MDALLSALHDLSWSIFLPAFCAGLLVIATHVPLGMQVLQRGIIFIDLAIAQVAVAGYMLGLVGSALFDLPTGPLSVWALAIVGVIALLLQRRRRSSHSDPTRRNHDSFFGHKIICVQRNKAIFLPVA